MAYAPGDIVQVRCGVRGYQPAIIRRPSDDGQFHFVSFSDGKSGWAAAERLAHHDAIGGSGGAQPVNSWAFTAIGSPAPQGSKRHVGRGVMVESSKALAPWRDTVTNAAYGAGPKLDGPVATLIIFTLPRPKSAPKRETLPQRGIDLDKAVRGVCDSITAAGLWEDDSRVCTLIAYKRWPAPSDALPVPGVVVACTRQSSSDWYDNETLLRLCIDQHRAAWGRYQQEVPA